MVIRKTNYSDVDEVVSIYNKAKSFMRNHDNPHQWDKEYPSKEVVLDDIKKGIGYVILDGDEIVGCFALIFGIDPTYIKIDGSWINDLPYGTIHRIASKFNRKGILKEAVAYALTKINNVKIDTHKDNYVMRNAIKRLGFTECGTIYLPNGDPRIAYQYSK